MRETVLNSFSQPRGIDFDYLRVGSGATPIIADFGKRRNCSNNSSILDLVDKR